VTSQAPPKLRSGVIASLQHPAPEGFFGSAVEGFFASDAASMWSHPFNDLIGPDAYHGAVHCGRFLASFNGLVPHAIHAAFGRGPL